MISPEKLKEISNTADFKINFEEIRNLSLKAIDYIDTIITTVANCGCSEIEINLKNLYQYVLNPNGKIEFSLFFIRHDFNIFCAHIRNELNKHNYTFEEKQYQWNAEPNPILIIRW